MILRPPASQNQDQAVHWTPLAINFHHGCWWLTLFLPAEGVLESPAVLPQVACCCVDMGQFSLRNRNWFCRQHVSYFPPMYFLAWVPKGFVNPINPYLCSSCFPTEVYTSHKPQTRICLKPRSWCIFFPANNNIILSVVEVGHSKLKNQDLILRGTCHVGLDAGCSSLIFFFWSKSTCWFNSELHASG